jgi:hypothetical protein
MKTLNLWKLRHVAIAAAALAAGAAHAQVPWTTVGSTGVVDDADTGIVDFVLGEARIRSTAVAGSQLNLRYNIVALPGFAGPGQYLMRVRFRDIGADANVRLDLRRAQTNGTSTLLATFDSNAYAANAGYQTQQKCIGVSWDFAGSAYYVDAALTKSGNAGTPALALIQLVPSNCIL